MSARAVGTVLIVAGLVVYLVISSLFVVSEGEQALVVQQAIAAQREFWLADAAWQAATLGLPAINDMPEAR